MNRFLQKLSDSCWYYYLKFSSPTPVFIFQMAKVGSSTVFFSLKDFYRGFLLHAHDFSPHHRLSKVRALYQYYQKHPEAPIKLITLVRDPINRNISTFFQDYERYNGEQFEGSQLTHKTLKANFLNNLKHEQPLIWMDRLKDQFGIDVYSKRFIGKDHLLFGNEQNVELILFRHDLDNERKAALLREFLGLKKLEVRNFNTSIRRVYGAAYRNFKKELKLPQAYLDRMKNSRYYQHFYAAEEIEDHLRPYS